MDKPFGVDYFPTSEWVGSWECPVCHSRDDYFTGLLIRDTRDPYGVGYRAVVCQSCGVVAVPKRELIDER